MISRPLKKDITTNIDLKRIAPYFKGPDAKTVVPFQDMVYHAAARQYLEKDIRTQAEFEAHVKNIRPSLYQKGQTVIKAVMAVGREYDTCFSLIQKLSLQYRDRPLPFDALTIVFNELKNICPFNFAELYNLDRIQHLPRYIGCMAVRARRAVDSPVKESKKAELIAPFERRLHALVAGLTDQASQEKTDAVEDFFWMVEEYKISVYAQELKTRFKISAKRLEKRLMEIQTMI